MKGKIILLQFWSLNSASSMREMVLMNTWVSKYGNRLEMISINIDDSGKEDQYYMKRKNYPWNFVHYSCQPDILNDYEVTSAPLYVLIDQQGNIAEYPAKAPSQGLEESIKKLF